MTNRLVLHTRKRCANSRTDQMHAVQNCITSYPVSGARRCKKLGRFRRLAVSRCMNYAPERGQMAR